jgi:hypothetical protein
MPSLNTRMPRHVVRTTGLVASAMVVALLAVGCSGPAPSATQTPSAAATATATPTPTPQAGSIEAPQSAEEAIEGATAAAQTYIDIRSEIEVDHPADSSAIDTIATGEIAADMHDIAADLAATGTLSTGHYSFEPTQGSAGDLTTSDGTVFPFGAVSLDGCFSTEEITSTDADGAPIGLNSIRRGVVTITAAYVPAEKTWLLTDLASPETENVPC